MEQQVPLGAYGAGAAGRRATWVRAMRAAAVAGGRVGRQLGRQRELELRCDGPTRDGPMRDGPTMGAGALRAWGGELRAARVGRVRADGRFSRFIIVEMYLIDQWLFNWIATSPLTNIGVANSPCPCIEGVAEWGVGDKNEKKRKCGCLHDVDPPLN
ncbi:hypothetical protein ABZP36_005744 [Zizania latifolia]